MSALRGATVGLAALALGVSTAAGQLAERVERHGDGVLRFVYQTRPGVEICDQGIRLGDRRVSWRSRGWDEYASSCRYGPAEVELRVEGGVVRDVEIVRRRADRTASAVEVGAVAPEAVAAFLLGLARDGASGRAAREAVFPAVLADVDDVWRDLLELARDRAVPREARKGAIFWLGQEAATAATEGLAQVAEDEQEEQEIREAAVFALSQRPDEEGVPILMELARTARESETRRSALFWLAQSDDERVLDFFEQILLRRAPGR